MEPAAHRSPLPVWLLDMAVDDHGEVNVAMPSDALRQLGMNARSREVSDEGMTIGVEVGIHAVFIPILQIVGLLSSLAFRLAAFAGLVERRDSAMRQPAARIEYVPLKLRGEFLFLGAGMPLHFFAAGFQFGEKRMNPVHN